MSVDPADPSDPSEPPKPPRPPADSADRAADSASAPVADDLPQPEVAKARRWGISLVWLLPAIAVAIGASMLIRTAFLSGPRVEIVFQSAEGVEAGKTDVRYKDVVIGKVTSVSLRGDDRHVVVAVQLDRSASQFAVEDTVFWVVRARIGAGGVTGLGTLLSGAYIAADAGVSRNTGSDFQGLETPPLVLRGEPGTVYTLLADDLGSLDVGSPVFHKRTRVGRVVGYDLDAARDALTVQIFIEAPYPQLVSTRTRFWNASGIDLTINASGLTLNTQTLRSIIAGGVAFDTPGRDARAPPPPAAASSPFTLFADRRTALAPPDGPPLPVRMVFDSSARGLDAGASVDLLGVEIGSVTRVALQYDEAKKRLPIEVEAVIYPSRLGAVRTALLRAAGPQGSDAVVLQKLVGNGMRAQLRVGNLLTGQLFVALDFIGKDGATAVVAGDGTLRLPVASGSPADLQPKVADIVDRIGRIPFEEIGRDLRSTLAGASTAISRLTPEAQRSLAEVNRTLQKAQASLDSLDRNIIDPNAPVQRNVDDTLQELQRASRALRTLADYLQQHPESLLRGKPPDPKVPQR